MGGGVKNTRNRGEYRGETARDGGQEISRISSKFFKIPGLQKTFIAIFSGFLIKVNAIFKFLKKRFLLQKHLLQILVFEKTIFSEN